MLCTLEFGDGCMNISFSKNMGYLISIKSTHEFSKLLSEHILLKSQENNLNLCSLSPLAPVTIKNGEDALVIAIDTVFSLVTCAL